MCCAAFHGQCLADCSCLSHHAPARPVSCRREQPGRPKCPLDPYFIMPDKCRCVDSQVLKMQELPESIPHGEMPRHLQMFCDRSAAAGHRGQVTGRGYVWHGPDHAEVLRPVNRGQPGIDGFI